MSTGGMTVRQAVVLAAGRGRRLGPATEACPKTLLPLGEGTLLSRLAGQLSRAGVEHLVLVVGYQAALFEDAVRGLGRVLPPQVRVDLAPNAHWQTHGSATSLLAARDSLWRGEPFLLAHGDLVLDDPALEALVERRESHVLADASWERLTGDEVLAWGRQGLLLGVGKGEAPPAPEVGEYLGLVRFEADVGRAFLDFCGRRAHADPEADYEQPLLDEFVGREPGAVGLTCLAGQPWRNVNDAADLAWARAHVERQASGTTS